MDYIRFKLAFSRHQQQSRFGNYNLANDLTDHQLIGLLPNQTDFQLGTPSLDRRENVTLVLSNGSSRDTLLLQLKWRPQVSGLVALASRLTLVLADNVYQFDQTEIYEPFRSSVWPEYIMQYGSRGSSLKLFFASPYRRLRLVFRGHMRQLPAFDSPTQDNSCPASKFIKLNLVINPTAGIYDFLRQFNTECFKTLYLDKKPTRSIEQTMAELLFCDRHEQPIRACGEYTVQEADNTKLRNNTILWGIHAREFIHDTATALRSKRILAHLMNGQLFHIGNNSIDGDSMDLGYTCFEVHFGMTPIDKPFFVDWEKVHEGTERFELEVSGEGRTFDCKAKRRFPGLGSFFEVEMNDKKGWAWVETSDSGADKVEELDRWQQMAREHEKSIQEGRLLPEASKQIITDSLEVVLVTSLADPQCADTNWVGSKASSLAHLDRFSRLAERPEGLQYTVPHAFVLTRFAYEAIFRHSPELEAETKRLESLIGEAQQLDNLRSECEKLQKLIEETALPEPVRLELTSKLKSHYGDGRLESTAFAVRSSSWGEDEEGMSAAGQLSTVLGVRGLEAITRAIMTCFASKYTHANVEYKRQHGLSPNLPMAVVVQEMVECEKAGVQFTCDPTSGDSSLLTITANYGLGESVVSGQSEPDCIRVRVQEGDDLKIEQVQIGSKEIVIDSGTLGGTSEHQYDKSKCCLADEEILRLARAGLLLANYFQCPRDIEWGFQDGRLYLFQSRPITGLDSYTERELIHETDQSSRAELDFMSRANIGEVLPYPIKPLTLTYVMRMWNIYGSKFSHKLQRHPSPFWPEASIDELMFYAYHVFFNMRCSMLFRQSPGDEKSLIELAIEVAFFGHEIGDQPELIEASKGLNPPENLFQGVRFDLYSLGLKLMPSTLIMREKHKMTATRRNMRQLKYATGYESNKMMGLLNQMRALYGVCQNGWENHITIIMLTNANSASLSVLLAKYIKDPVQLFTAMSKLLANNSNVISAEIPQRIEFMSRLIREKGPQEVERFLASSEREALEYLGNKTQNELLNKEFEAFLEKFGHRCYNEFEMADRSWRESPGRIVEMLKQNCKSTKELGDPDKKSPGSLDQIVESLNLDLTFKDRALLKHVIGPRGQNLVAAREMTKDILIDHTDLMREATRMLAKEMRRNLRLPDEDLLYYLVYHELEPLIREPQPAIVVQATRRRNMFKSQFKEVWKFDEIIKGPEVVPNHMKPSSELDAAIASAPKLYGTPASSGRAQARVCLVMNYSELDKVKSGDILVTHSTDIGFSPVFPLLSGLVTEVGGLISHGAVVAREYGLPSLLGIPHVTRILKDGEQIILDADNGVIIRLSQ